MKPIHIPSLTSECISNTACTSVGACISNHRGVIITEGHKFKIYNFLKTKLLVQMLTCFCDKDKMCNGSVLLVICS